MSTPPHALEARRVDHRGCLTKCEYPFMAVATSEPQKRARHRAGPIKEIIPRNGKSVASDIDAWSESA
jgi:hypothetical protein